MYRATFGSSSFPIRPKTPVRSASWLHRMRRGRRSDCLSSQLRKWYCQGAAATEWIPLRVARLWVDMRCLWPPRWKNSRAKTEVLRHVLNHSLFEIVFCYSWRSCTMPQRIWNLTLSQCVSRERSENVATENIAHIFPVQLNLRSHTWQHFMAPISVMR